RNIFELLLAGILEIYIDLAPHLAVGIVGDANAARLGNAFQPRSNIDAVAEDVVVLDHDVADVNADPQFDAALRRHARVALSHATLDVDGAARGIDRAAELDQH